MQVNITSVELKPKAYRGAVTNYYVLTDDQGNKYQISEKSRYTWQNVQGKGTYEIEMGEYMGHPVVKKLKPIVTSGDNAPAAKSTSVTQTVAPTVAADKARLDFAAAKQNEIKLECYAGIAKDILIANGKKDITAMDVMQFAKDMMVLHNDIIALGDDLPGYGVDFLKDLREAFPNAVVEKTETVKPVQQQFNAAEEEPPF